MAYIKSRKHQPAQAPRLAGASAALTAVALALPGAGYAQQQQEQAADKPAAAASAAATADQQALPEVKARAQATSEGSYKADTVSSPKFMTRPPWGS